jgi:hypothetical protein
MILSYDRRRATATAAMTRTPSTPGSSAGSPTGSPVGARYQLGRPMLKLRPDATPNVVFRFCWNIDTLNVEGDDWYRRYKATAGGRR